MAAREALIVLIFALLAGFAVWYPYRDVITLASLLRIGMVFLAVFGVSMLVVGIWVLVIRLLSLIDRWTARFRAWIKSNI